MATTFSAVANNYASQVTVGRSIGGSSLVVASVAGLPVLTAGQSLRLSVFRNNVPVTILRVTGINTGTNTFTISGALEMADAAVQVNDLVMVTDTAGLYQEIEGAINNIETGVTSLSVLATGSSTYRTLNDRFGEVYNALDWGVIADSSTDAAPAINALIAHLLAQPSFSPFTIYFPAGSYAINSPIHVAKSLGTGQQTTALRIVGDGYQTQFVSRATMTEMIRIEDSNICIFERFRLTCSASVTVAALHITAITSAVDNTFRNIYVDCQNACPVGIGVGLNTTVPVAQCGFWSCTSVNATKASIRLGNGTTANTVDIRFASCYAGHSPVGVWMDGSSINWTGGVCATNTIVDFFMSQPAVGPVVIEGTRSEGSNMLFMSAGGGDCAPIRLSDIHVSYFTATDYNYDPVLETFTSGIVSGFVVSHRFDGVLTLMNCSFWHGPSIYPGGRLDVNSSCQTVLINCELGPAGQSAANYATSNYAYGGKGTGKDYSVIGGKTMTTGSTSFDSPIASLCDGPAFFNNTIAVNTTAPTRQYHQIGGGHYLQQIADPVTGPSISQGGTPGSTPYVYYYVYKDQVGHKTNVSPAGTTSSGNATLSTTNYNIVTIPTDLSVSTIDILRGDTSHSVVTDWNPYLTSPYFVYHDISPGTSSGYTAPTRNGTADMTIDGNLDVTTINSGVGGTTDASLYLVTATGSNTARNLATRYFAPFNVMDWGAKGDGVTDDQPAIMALLRYVSNLSVLSSSPRTIYFPAGNYMINNPIKVGKQYHLKADNSAWPAGTQWPGLNIIGEGHATQITSNNASGMTEMLRIEDVFFGKLEGFRFLVKVGCPVTVAAVHITAIFSGESHTTRNIEIECQGNVGGSCPVGLGISLDYPNDTAQLEFYDCKISYATYAGIMIGSSIVGNVLDLRFWGCVSVGSPVGVFGNAAPFQWYSGAATYNWVCDFYQNGPTTGPTLVDGVRSELSNRFYLNYGGGSSRSPITLSNSTIASWYGARHNATIGTPPFFTIPVSATFGSTTITGTGTFFKTHERVIVGSKLVFQNDPTNVYTVNTITSDTILDLTTTYAGVAGTNSTYCDLAAPVFTRSLTAGVDTNMPVVLSTVGGVTTVTGTGTHFNTQLTTLNSYLVFANDPVQQCYQVATITSATVLTLSVAVPSGLLGSTTCNAPTMEAYAMAHRSGGVFHMQALTFTHGPAPYYFARFDLLAANLIVTAVNVNTGQPGTAASIRNNCYNTGDHHVVGGTRFMVLPGPANNSGEVNSIPPLGLLCDYSANFNDKLSLNIYDSQTDQYHQLGGGMKVAKLVDPTDAISSIVYTGTPGAITYYYWYVITDLMNHKTLNSPVASIASCSAISASNTNLLTIPSTSGQPNVAGAIYYDILRNTANALSGANFGSVATGWNPYTSSPNFKFTDNVVTPSAYTVPTRNGTGDIVAGGVIHLNGTTSPYAGTGAGEINGAQTASVTDVTTTKMIQTLWNWARATGMMA